MTSRLTRSLALSAALAAGASVSAGAQETQRKAAPGSIAGTWNVTLMSHQVALVLEQDGTRVTGTLMMMGSEAKVDGTFVDGVLKLTSNARVMARPPAATHEEGHAAPPGSTKEGTALTLTAKLQDDGTLVGEAPGPNGPATWTGERLKEPKPKKSTAAPTGPGLTGAWKMAAASPEGAMTFELMLKQEGERITGTLASEQIGELALEGTFSGGSLPPPAAVTAPTIISHVARLKDDGTPSAT